MKMNASKITLVLFLLFVGTIKTNATCIGDCLLHVLQYELNEKNSKDVYDYFLNKSDKDANEAYQAWEVLYKADNKVDRLNINNLEAVYTYIKDTNKTVDDLVAEIKHVKGFANWNNFKYQFQKEGYVYGLDRYIDPDGTVMINHFLKKDGKTIPCGFSRISPEGILYNTFEIPEHLKRKGISNVMYKNNLKENIKNISSLYQLGSDNYKAFMTEFKLNGNKVKAFLNTAEGKVLEKYGYVPENSDIKIEIDKVIISLNKNETDIANSIPWINNLPSELRSLLFKEKGELYQLFKNANPTQREKLAKSWGIIKHFNIETIEPKTLESISKIANRFKYNDEEGFEALLLVFNKHHEEIEIEIINNLIRLDDEFDSTLNLPIYFTVKDDVKNSTFNPIAIDGIGDEVANSEYGILVNVKYFSKISDSHIKEGKCNGLDIYRKGEEVGFNIKDKLGYKNAAEVIDINTAIKYKFQNKGYTLVNDEEILPDGVKKASFFLKKEGEEAINIGYSTISNDGVLENVLLNIKQFREDETANAVYDIMLREDVKIISNFLNHEKYFSEEYKKYREVLYADDSRNKEKAILSTEQAKILVPRGWQAEIKGDVGKEIVVWRKKGAKVTFKPDNVIDIKTGLKPQSSFEGYAYAPKFETDTDGSKSIEHFMKKEGKEDVLCGFSKISRDKELSNTFGFTEETINYFDEIYNALLKEDIESVSSFYMKGQLPDEYTDFMSEFNHAEDKIGAAFYTSEGFILRNNGFKPVEIVVDGNGKGIRVLWKKEGTNKVANELWTENLPTELNSYFSENKEELYDLFADANPTEREKLVKSWEVLKNPDVKTIKPEDLELISRIADRFKYNKDVGFMALDVLFNELLTNPVQKMELFNWLEELSSLFDNTLNLPIKLSCVEGKEKAYKAIVIDGLGDEVIGIDDGNIIKSKFFEKIDESYEKVGEFNGASIYQKNGEVGFKSASAEVIDINAKK